MSRYVDKKEYIERVNRAIKRRVEVEAERDALAVEVAQLRAALRDFYPCGCPRPVPEEAGHDKT